MKIVMKSRISELVELLYYSAQKGCEMWSIPFKNKQEALELVSDSWWIESVDDLIENTNYTAKEINTAFKLMVEGV